MRIKSNFKDYYDGLQSYDSSDKFVYNRFPIVGECQPTQNLSRIIDKFLVCVEYNMVMDLYVSKIQIGFCGKQYLALKLYRSHNNKPINVEYCYSVSDIDKYVERYCTSKQQKYYNKLDRNHYLLYCRCPCDRDYFVELFDKTFPEKCAQQKDYYNEIFNEDCCPVYIVTSKGFQKRERLFTINGSLDSVAFHKVLDSYQTFQEISMYLGNIAFPEKIMPVIDDLTMLESKGFDKRFSFRKDKTLP